MRQTKNDGGQRDASVSMEQIPVEARPYERCLTHGPASLSDCELLAILLRTGTRGVNSMQLAEQILSLSKEPDRLSGLLRVHPEQFAEIPGVGKVKTVQILSMLELSRRIWKGSSRKRLCFTQPGTVADYYMEDMRHRTSEISVCAYLNSQKELIGDSILSIGSLEETIMHPRNVFAEALRRNAAALILLHNHPSGCPQPSSADCSVTRRIAYAGKLMGIPLIDHIVIGDRCYTSFLETPSLRHYLNPSNPV